MISHDFLNWKTYTRRKLEKHGITKFILEDVPIITVSEKKIEVAIYVEQLSFSSFPEIQETDIFYLYEAELPSKHLLRDEMILDNIAFTIDSDIKLDDGNEKKKLDKQIEALLIPYKKRVLPIFREIVTSILKDFYGFG